MIVVNYTRGMAEVEISIPGEEDLQVPGFPWAQILLLRVDPETEIHQECQLEIQVVLMEGWVEDHHRDVDLPDPLGRQEDLVLVDQGGHKFEDLIHHKDTIINK